MIQPRFLLTTLCLGLGACAASAWQVPESVTQARAAMNAASAEASLKKALIPDAKANGLCGRVTAGPSFPLFEDLRDGKLTFSDKNLRAVPTNVRVSGGTATVSGEMRYEGAGYTFDFNAVNRVFIMGPIEPGQCSKAPVNRPITVRDESGLLINVDLAPENYETFIAAVMFLSPQARITQGAGL
jgi:hypothetical protein